MTQAVEQKEKRLDNPYDFFDGFDEEEIEEGLNDRTQPIFDDLREYEHFAYDADSPDLFAQQLLYLRYAYIQEGSLYYHIWQNCLWKYAGASSFTAYCKREFGTRWYQIKGKVQASRIACYLLSEGFNELPKYQKQLINVKYCSYYSMKQLTGVMASIVFVMSGKKYLKSTKFKILQAK